MFATVGDIIMRENKANVYTYDDKGLSYVVVVKGNKYRKAYKVSNTSNNGLVLMAWPLSRARLKLMSNKLKSVYDNGNVKLLRGSKGPHTVKVGKEA